QSRLFFEKHGGRAIIFARFLPILRTFAPIVAGIVQMEKKKFMFFNIVSSFLWSFTLIFSGHYLYRYLLDNHNMDLKANIEYIVIAIIILSTSPLAINYLKNKIKERRS
ncbi:MAG: DedA family protein, partial [Flavobacterium sp.]|nr:DedA family protein [Flavobacterium sp.]